MFSASTLVCLFLGLFLFSSPVSSSNKTGLITYDIQYQSLYTEGCTYWQKGNLFLFGSFFTGGIVVSFDASTNSTELFATIPKNDSRASILTTAGLFVDEVNQILYACAVGPLLQPGFFGVAAWNLTNKESLFVVDYNPLVSAFGSVHLANDVTSDLKGNIYITDTISNVVIKANAFTGAGSLLFDNTLFPATPGAIGFDGIVYHGPSNTLIINVQNTGSLVRYSLTTGTSGIIPIYPRHGKGTVQAGPVDTWLSKSSTVQDGLLLPSPDGMILTADNKYLLAMGNPNGLVTLMEQAPSSSDWSEIRVVRSKFFPKKKVATRATFSPSDLTFDNAGRLFLVDGQTFEPINGIASNRKSFVATQIRFRRLFA